MPKIVIYAQHFFLPYILGLIFVGLNQPVIAQNSYNNFNVLISTFLGNAHRNYYGNIAPDTLEVIWKLYLGEGETVISRKIGSKIWSGAGWTGQPLLVEEDSSLYLIQGAYDHNLKKIDATSGQIVWQYAFDDVVKGTGTIWEAQGSISSENKLVILQGSRLGVGNYLDSKHIPSYRAISYFTGKELWRLDVKWTDSYSRDADGSALVVNDTVYIGLENSLFTVINPYPDSAKIKDGMLQPSIIQEIPLYDQADAVTHKNNIVTESSPCLLNGVIYVTSGSGHVYGYSLKEKKLVWDFFIGSDLDGSAVVTNDSCILVSVEKQYIDGHGGAFKLDPAKPPKDAVVWYLPVADTLYSGWEGGIIGSPGVNDYNHPDEFPYLAAFNTIEGLLYVVDHTSTDTTAKVPGPRNEGYYSTPKILFKYQIGASISTPILVGNKIIACGYGGIFLFEYDANSNFKKIARFPVSVESTPIVHNGRIYVASRDGYLYCLGRKM